MTPQEYCQDKTSSSGSSFYYSFLFLPADTRRAITALYAFCREVDDVVDECKELSVAQQKLDWWRSEIEQAYAGNAHHPVCMELQLIIPRYELEKELFMEIINGMQMDLMQSSYATLDDLKLYCCFWFSIFLFYNHEDNEEEIYSFMFLISFMVILYPPLAPPRDGN